jgi:hypothetical protein
MAQSMVQQGVGVRSSVMLALGLMLGALGGCITAGESKADEGTQASAANARDQVVVQSNRPEPASVRPATPLEGPVSVEASRLADAKRSSATGVARAGESRAKTRSGELITPRHLEAELNRLEAELGR